MFFLRTPPGFSTEVNSEIPLSFFKRHVKSLLLDSSTFFCGIRSSLRNSATVPSQFSVNPSGICQGIALEVLSEVDPVISSQILQEFLLGFHLDFQKCLRSFFKITYWDSTMSSW